MSNHQNTPHGPVTALALSALGVVYGDIGTSPLYAIRETFGGAHPITPDAEHILGVLSLVFWAIGIVVSTKYLGFMLRADNRGEGGSLALLALVSRITGPAGFNGLAAVLGIFAAALFYGDSMLTPAISVLSAVEGLDVALPGLSAAVLPITLVIILGLFSIQKHGTARVGAWFGPIMAIWFLTLAVLGLVGILRQPQVLQAINPYYAWHFAVLDGSNAFFALGAVVLAITGTEALYADMGHFGKRPIRLAWSLFVFPALVLNYFGQGALMLSNPEARTNPFFLLAPDWALLPLVGLATLATVIASQAVISGAYSMTRQAIQLGYLPRMKISHTSEQEMGQIYIPFINWTLFICVLALVLGFQSSSNLAAAYGVAVTGTMIIDSFLLGLVMLWLWRWYRVPAGLLLLLFLSVDIAFFAANALKIPHGGWFPLAIGLIVFLLLTTWKRGRALLLAQNARDQMPVGVFLQSVVGSVPRVPGTAIYMTGTPGGIPHAMLHNLKHNKVLHEQVVLLTVRTEEVPHTPPHQRLAVSELGHGFYRLILHFGFKDDPDIPQALGMWKLEGEEFELMNASFFINRETLIPSRIPGMALWREHLFAWMSRNATSAMSFYRIPPNRVIELGTQIEI